ncbi:chloramphenicol phosphotransferase [Deinococcus cavernae]|uniref:Chloramphenicol phosphotransferase n=1 Tax=Deinococcus cavernae TaxID=2320857 RepID=A0A418VCW7_9DEIO|nr:chloramphenicol phosphotransferase [Deinococcus cavernae]
MIVLNGASSSGKSTLGRALQDRLPGTWLLYGVDDLVRALPPRLTSPEGIEFSEDGQVRVGPAFRAAEKAWMQGVAHTARCGVNVIIDDVFLGGPAAQARWQEALLDLRVLCVGVHCQPEVGEAREQARGDRVTGMHRQQAQIVHQGVQYDLEVDSAASTPAALAQLVVARLNHP